MLTEGSLPCKAHKQIQYILNKGAVNELNKNNQKKERNKKKTKKTKKIAIHI